MKTTTFGQRGGTGVTRGRKAETIEATICGKTYRKRVFFGQRALTLCAREDGAEIVTAWADEAEAEAHLARVSGDDWPVQIATSATLSSQKRVD